MLVHRIVRFGRRCDKPDHQARRMDRFNYSEFPGPIRNEEAFLPSLYQGLFFNNRRLDIYTCIRSLVRVRPKSIGSSHNFETRQFYFLTRISSNHTTATTLLISFKMAPLIATSTPLLDISARQSLETFNNRASTSRHETKVPAPTKPRHAVRFEPRVRCRKAIHLNDFTEDELSACWYSHKEFMSMKAEVRYTSGLIEAGLLDDDSENYCRRGADAHSPEEVRQRRLIKQAVRTAVLEEQTLQWREGSCDPEFIAEVSRVKSSQSAATSRKNGIADEKMVSFLSWCSNC